jgi:hypothetical protein
MFLPGQLARIVGRAAIYIDGYDRPVRQDELVQYVQHSSVVIVVNEQKTSKFALVVGPDNVVGWIHRKALYKV